MADDAGYENLCRIITRIHRRLDGPTGRVEGEPGPTPLVGDLAEQSGGLHLIVEQENLAASLARAGVPRRRLWVGLDPATQSRSRIRRLLDCAARLDLAPVAAGTALLAGPEDLDAARVLAAARTGSTFAAVADRDLPHPRAVLRGPNELARQRFDHPRAVGNNRRLAEACAQFRLLPREPVFPAFPCPGAKPRDPSSGNCAVRV